MPTYNLIPTLQSNNNKLYFKRHKIDSDCTKKATFVIDQQSLCCDRIKGKYDLCECNKVIGVCIWVMVNSSMAWVKKLYGIPWVSSRKFCFMYCLDFYIFFFVIIYWYRFSSTTDFFLLCEKLCLCSFQIEILDTGIIFFFLSKLHFFETVKSSNDFSRLSTEY